MVYIRAKKVKSDQYLYLVKSVWDSKKKTSKQEIVKYLGKSSEVVNDAIPIDYRNNLKILSAIAKYNPKNIKNNEVATKKIKEKLYKKLTEGDIQESIKIYQEYIKNFDFANFFDNVLKPVMYKIGEDWVKDEISIANEHIASNTAQILVRTIMEQVSGNTKKEKILICVPIGEEHRLGCDVLETYLLSKGFKIYNMGTSIPTESILSFIENNKPDVVFLSITLKDNLKAGQRLVKKIKEQSEIPILVGGFAIQEEMALKFDARVISDVKLDEIPKILKSI
jgi:MerR family transcriptional regulator, light-induced transcriptional regulator